ncbi:MAG: M48 family metalloprotease [Opitutaceae bacterium]|nr:M48 family metalloprotease [Opitutaceae bacterium]
MDFFEQQAATRRRSTRLLLLFALAVTAFLILLGVLPSLLLAGWSLCFGPGWHWRWDWSVFGLVSGSAGFCFAAGAAIEWLNLADGGAALASRIGAEPLPPDSVDPAARRLLNIVEEMAIASGHAAPRLFVLRHESAINALSAGHEPRDAALIVTRGCLDRLTRDELQGVVAHEFSHLLHGDTSLDTRLTALLAGLLFIPELGRDLLRAGWTEHTDPRTHHPVSGPTPLLVLAPLALVLLGVGLGGFLLARALQSAVARQRELLADASAVQFTRLPAGLAGALGKIAASPDEQLTGAAGAAKLGHLYFATSRRSLLLDWFSTHPPLAARLTALAGRSAGAESPNRDTSTATRRRALPGFSTLREELGSYVDSPSAPSAAHLGYSQRLLAELPPSLVSAAREPNGAPAVVLGLLLAADPAFHPAQLELVRHGVGPEVARTLVTLTDAFASVPRAQRLPLLGLALPVLHALPASSAKKLVSTAHALAAHDDEIHLFEFALLKALERHLAPPPAARAFGHTSIDNFAGPIGILLSACARTDAADAAAAARSFAAGAALFSGIPQLLELAPPARCGLDSISAALDRLAAAPVAHRRVLLAACARAASSDRRVTLDEAELLRAIADALDCPIPPLVGSADHA